MWSSKVVSIFSIFKSLQSRVRIPTITFERTSNLNFIFGLLILALCILFASPVILIPQHDGILYPDYWYEIMICANLTFCLNWTIGISIDVDVMLNLSTEISKWSYVRMFFVSSVFFDIIYSIAYVIWTRGLDYNYPIPFGILAIYVTATMSFATMWYIFPIDLRQNQCVRTRIKAFCLLYLYATALDFQFNLLRKLFLIIPYHLQWILAFMLPILRYINEKGFRMMQRRAAGSENLKLKAYACITINIYYSLFIAILMGSSATPTTSFCILLLDFVLNLVGCIKIIRISRKISQEDAISNGMQDKKNEEVTLLALTELTEILVPLSYITTFLIAFYGPNSYILGGIRNSYWTFIAVKDVYDVLSGTSLMFLFDCCFGLISGLMLVKFAKLNMLKEYGKLLNEYWLLITIRLANVTTRVCGYHD